MNEQSSVERERERERESYINYIMLSREHIHIMKLEHVVIVFLLILGNVSKIH